MKKIMALILPFMLYGCYDYTRFLESDICPTHEKKMTRVVKTIIYGKACFVCSQFGSYYHAGGCVVRPEKFAISYICPDCRKAWLQKKKGNR